MPRLFTIWLLSVCAFNGLDPTLCLANDQFEFFELKIRPALIEHCYECHSSDSDEAAGGLLLDSRDGMREGGETGPAVVAGDLSESLLMSAIEYRDLEMPPTEKLDDSIIADFRHWIESGAADPRGEEMASEAKHASPSADKESEVLWSLQPIANPAIPNVKDNGRVATDIDRFVLASLEKTSLKPNPPATMQTLLRRVSFDLVGLPPSIEESVAAESWTDQAYSDYVDRLLDSPQFGERWARHWLDVVRYGESAGSSRDVLMLYSWRYRDYVIDAFNNDITYSKFIRQQVAGDLMLADSEDARKKNLIATGVLAIGSKSLNGGNLALDIADDQIDVIGKAMLGLTVSCARCHDHKFDPIPTADYYALAGVFRNTRTFYGGSIKRPKTLKEQLNVYLPLSPVSDDSDKTRRDLEKKIETTVRKQNAAKKRLQVLEKRLPKNWKQLAKSLASPADVAAERISARERQQIQQYQKLEQDLKAFASSVKLLNEELASQPMPDFAFGTQDVPKPRDWPIQVHGDGKKNGDIVTRGFLSCVSLPDTPSIPADESGRRQLADWLVHPDNPLTARVFVNRVWQHLFGRGFVESTNNFGVSGATPSHPELLDFLAHRFIRHHKWSVKSLIRELVHSSTYQMSSANSVAGWEQDPSNILLWRANRRRLEAEAIRDAMLAVSGEIDLVRPEGSLVQHIGEGEVGRNIDTKPLEEPFRQRSVYLPIIRGLLPEMLSVFDFPDPSNSAGQRNVTNVPTQSLFLLNSPFVVEQSTALARRILKKTSNPQEQVVLAWQACFSRRPESGEIQEALEFLQELTSSIENSGSDPWQVFCQSLLSSAEFRFLD